MPPFSGAGLFQYPSAMRSGKTWRGQLRLAEIAGQAILHRRRSVRSGRGFLHHLQCPLGGDHGANGRGNAPDALFGWLVLAAALPFGVYSLLYKVFIETWGIEFDDSLSRVHFGVTIFGVILVIWQWEQSVMFRMTSLPGPEALSAIAALSAIVFVINACRGFRRRQLPQRK